MTHSETNPQNIFLVDDDKEDRELFAEALSQVDKTVKLTEFSSCYKLIETLDDHNAVKPDIIFLDMDIPKFNGQECLKKLKASSRLKDLKIVILSTFSHPEYIELAYQNGACSYYVKPARFTNLKEIISDALKGNWKNRLHSKKGFVVKYLSAVLFISCCRY